MDKPDLRSAGKHVRLPDSLTLAKEQSNKEPDHPPTTPPDLVYLTEPQIEWEQLPGKLQIVFGSGRYISWRTSLCGRAVVPVAAIHGQRPHLVIEKDSLGPNCEAKVRSTVAP